MGFPKPLLRIGSQTFIQLLSRMMLERLPKLVVVLGAHADTIRPAIPDDSRIEVVVNPNYALGQLSSLKVALRHLDPDIGAAMLHLCDHPVVRAETIDQLLAHYGNVSAPIVIPRYQSRRGHPVIFAREVFPELLSADENLGARSVVDRIPGRVRYVDVDDRGIRLDLDTPEDLAREGLQPPPKNS
jgi:molybdenum cofactor cytidylyltransferase